MRHALLFPLCLVLLATLPAPTTAPHRDVDEPSARAAMPARPLADDPTLHDPDSALWQRYFVYDEAYYAAVDPTRIHVDKPLAPGERRPRLAPLGPTSGHGRALRPHERPLAVRTQPHAPVTWFAPDWGTFANGERSITLQADARGRAAVTFTYGRMASYHHVVAHSPEAVGWVVFDLVAVTDGPVALPAGQAGRER